MKVALLQMSSNGSSEKNLQKAKENLSEAAENGADVALLPECWNVGYVSGNDYPGGAEAWHAAAITKGDKQYAEYVQLAKDFEIAIALPFLERDGDELFDAVSVIDMKGETVLSYRKVQTVRKNWEAELSAGDDFPVAELRTKTEQVKIGCMICFDREFPEVARILMHRGAEIVLVPNACNLETNRLAQFQARGFENMIGVAMTNYPSPAPFNGRSVAFDGMREKGKEYDPKLVLAGSDEGVYYADFDLSKLRAYRERELWGDAYRKPALYKELLDTKKSYPFLREDAE